MLYKCKKYIFSKWIFRNVVVVMNISGQEPCVSGPSPCYMFLRGALVIFGKYIQGASQIFTMPSRCRVRMNFLSLPSTDSVKKKNHTENAWNLYQGPASLRACIAPASHWSFAPDSVANSPFFQHTVIYVVPSVCELVCKTAALILSGSNLEKTTHQWASTMPSFPPPVLQSHHTWPRVATFFPLSKLRDRRLQCMSPICKSKQPIVTSHSKSQMTSDL